MSTTIPPLGTKEYLVALRDTCNSILRECRPAPFCMQAIVHRDQDDSQWFTVKVDAPNFGPGDILWLHDELATAGFKDVEVRTEW